MLSDRSHLLSYENAIEDFHFARRKASLQAVLSRISGKSPDLLSYDEVRGRLGGVENAYGELKDIPLDSIVGTVSRYQDFTRTLLPLNSVDQVRWARVRLATEKMEGLPPIEVYQIGEAYFILDGHHRASVAREMGATHIQAYVREVRTLVPVSPDDRYEDIILKSEYSDFLKKTRINEIRPDADLHVTVPGEYDTLLEHISVHRYFQGIDEEREVSYEDAVAHWYDVVYEPVVRIIRQRNILKDFPDRSEADLYLWIMDHRSTLETDLGWKVDAQTAVNDLSSMPGSPLERTLHKSIQRIFDAITPDEIEPSVPPGEWREKRNKSIENRSLFNNILVGIPDDPVGWQSLKLAQFFAEKEDAFLGGLHLVPPGKGAEPARLEDIRETFRRSCEEAGVEGSLVVENGPVTETLFDRSSWADLMVLSMLYPPPLQVVKRLRSGLRTLIRLSQVPLLIYPPGAVTSIRCAVLAYGGGPRADEALFVATYLASRWGLKLTVATADRGRPGDARLIERARQYLTEHCVENVDYLFEQGDPAKLILQAAKSADCDLIIMGGYESRLIRELYMGSTVDRVLWSTDRAVLICR
ncbi:MAG TPA: universal stress protein [Anaerolinea sp.]|nr:universal stress protein [Anaerolinea sp.]